MTSRALNDVHFARDELYQRASETITPSADYIRKHRLDWQIIEACCGCLSILPVSLFPQNRFDFESDHDAVLAAVVEVFDRDYETVVDLVAWPVAQPHHVCSMFGRAALLGLGAAFSPTTYLFDNPLLIHRTPLAWLQAGGEGAAIVTARLAAHVLLEVPGRIAGQDEEHTRELVELVSSIIDLRRFVVPVRRIA